MIQFNDSDIWVPCTDVAVAVSDSPLRYALLSMRQSQPIVLEGSAALLWELIGRGNKAIEIVDQIVALCDAHRDDVKKQLLDYARALQDGGYLELLTTQNSQLSSGQTSANENGPRSNSRTTE